MQISNLLFTVSPAPTDIRDISSHHPAIRVNRFHKKNMIFKTLLPAALSVVLSTQPAQAQDLIPLPQKMEWGKGCFEWSKPYVVQTGTPMASSFAEKYRKRQPLSTTKEKETRRCILFQTLPADAPAESYRLRISPDTIVIAARETNGFLYAHTTLQQLEKNGKTPCALIEDAPAYEWRGVMLDVSRHFFPVSFLKKHIDLLSSYKINRLHLHLTDAAGWRIEIKRYPRLTRLAAWRSPAKWKNWWNSDRRYVEQGSEGAYGGYYTQEELRELVAYASERGITIIPEIEMPAHSEEVLTAYPELSCTHEPYKQADFCPGSVATYDFLENVLREVMEIFPSPYIHVGGDEAGKASWPDCPRCQQKMKEEGIADVNGLQTHLIRHIGHFLQAHGRRLLGWDEIIDRNLADGTTVMVWRDVKNAAQAARLGYDVILSPGAYCYLDSYQDAPHTQPEAIGGFLTLERVYSYVPGEGMTDEEKKHIKGIQGNLWTEYVPTEAHAEYMLYPRVLALAEIGWNGTADKNYKSFRQRAVAETDRLREKGVNAFDLHKEIGDRPQSLQPVRHLAVGAKVTYNKPFNPYYPAQKEATLTDGTKGGWSHGDGRWQGFIGQEPFDITIDLGKVERVRRISTEFMQNSGPDIFYPGQYRISVSTNGKQYQEIYSKKHNVEKLPLYETSEWAWKGKTRARYIRIQAQTGQLRGWIFADEVEIE